MDAIKLQLKDIPKVNSPLRRQLLKFTTEEFYQKEIEEGIPFFSDNDLIALEEKYKNGITKKELMSELYKKGWQIKESTIKSYISKDLLPRALKRVKTNKGMESIYPSSTIRHLNFTRYCLFSDDYSIRFLLSRFQHFKESQDIGLLIEASAEIESPDPYLLHECYECSECLEPYEFGFSQISGNALSKWASQSIRKAFLERQPEKCELYLAKLKEVDDTIRQAKQKFDEFKELLTKNSTPYYLVSDSEQLKKWKKIREIHEAIQVRIHETN
jgi:uncharacterized cysteine cluster protein YcgN (CxxCxxCC family)